MAFSLLIKAWAICFSLCSVLGVPLSKIMGCGESGNLPAFKAEVCCTRYKLHCPKGMRVEDTPSKANEEKIVPMYRRVFSRGVRVYIRNLGEQCKSSSDRCAVGLHCRNGFCVRTPSAHHLKTLLQRGKLVEKEEEALLDLGTDEERDSLLGIGEVTVRGQAVQIDEDTDESQENLRPRVTPMPLKRSDRRHAIEKEVQVKDAEPVAATKVIVEEEDELTENISDLLSSKMGISLDKSEKRSVRQIIAGTLDERAQREDQIAQNEEPEEMKASAKQEQKDEGKHCSRDMSRSNVSESVPQTSFFEPLVQCAPDSKNHPRGAGSGSGAAMLGVDSKHTNVNM